jgi:hypothetical protein
MSKTPIKSHRSKSPSSYLVSVDQERTHKGPRFLWTVCAAHNPDELLSWGDSPTPEQALETANKEVERLKSGSHGGRVRSPKIRDRQDVRTR